MTATRALTARYTITGTLVATSPLHIGAAAPGATIDLEQVRDGLGRFVIPGTSLAGVLRAALTGGDGSDSWWGTHLAGGPEDAQAFASLITVADAPATDSDRTVVRDGVGIDRITGTAAHRHLFTRQVVPTGTRFPFTAWLEVADPDSDTTAAALMRRLTARLIAGITAGAAGNAGLGRLRLEDPALRREDFTSPAGLFAALESGGEPLEPTESAPSANTLRITIPWKPLGPIMSKVTAAAGEAAAWPALDTDATGTRLRLLIPGTSVKGILRGHAERIVRTTTEARVADTPDPVAQLEQSAELPGIGELFGAAGNLANKNPGRRGLLSVNELTTTATIPAESWNRVRDASAHPAAGGAERDARRAAFAKAVDELNAETAPAGVWFDIAARTAIDRWTGAASDGLLFTALEPHTLPDATGWSPIELELDLRQDTSLSTEALVALLLLLVRDLAEGWIPFGFGTTRGLGAIRADPGAITIAVDADLDIGATLRALDGRTLHDILTTPDLAAGLEAAWQQVLIPAGAVQP